MFVWKFLHYLRWVVISISCGITLLLYVCMWAVFRNPGTLELEEKSLCPPTTYLLRWLITRFCSKTQFTWWVLSTLVASSLGLYSTCTVWNRVKQNGLKFDSASVPNWRVRNKGEISSFHKVELASQSTLQRYSCCSDDSVMWPLFGL